ncbi:hypothetical protein HY214_03485 [Candidatus Roizmanbacteria bacterium]|nr:hypothetical protein [Candidatus Roizmanbacteria bacterium]
MLVIVSFPIGAKCLVKTGQMVDFTSPFYTLKEKSERRISLAKHLKVPPAKIFKYLKKFVGEPVKHGDIIALKNSLFSSDKVVCDEDGVIKEINHYEGEVIIAAASQRSNTRHCYFIGRVEETAKNQISINVEQGEVYPIKKATQPFGGETVYLQKNEVVTFSESAVGKKILVCETLTPYQAAKAEALDAKGYVGLLSLDGISSLPSAQFQKIEDYKKAVGRKYTYCLVDPTYSRMYFYRF